LYLKAKTPNTELFAICDKKKYTKGWKSEPVNMASSSAYEDVRAAIFEKGNDARVEVNQRALIDKVS
jgi:hypothetical protein